MYFNQVKFGCRLRNLRKQRRMTQEALAGSLNISIVVCFQPRQEQPSFFYL